MVMVFCSSCLRDRPSYCDLDGIISCAACGKVLQFDEKKRKRGVAASVARRRKQKQQGHGAAEVRNKETGRSLEEALHRLLIEKKSVEVVTDKYDTVEQPDNGYKDMEDAGGEDDDHIHREGEQNYH